MIVSQVIALRYIAILAICGGTFVQAQTPSEKTYLWHELYAGMPKRDVKAAYPKYQGELFPGCPVRVLSTYRDGGLKSIILLARNKEPGCLEKVVAQLTAEQGSPASSTDANQRTIFTPVFLPGSVARTDTIWNAKKYRIILSNFPRKKEYFTLAFTTECVANIC